MSGSGNRAWRVWALSLLMVGLCAGEASAQALMRARREQTLSQDGTPDANASLREVSLMLVEPPKPRKFAVHDIITIIINETSSQTSQQMLDTKTDSSMKGSLNKFPDLGKLIEGELTNGASSPIASVDIGASEKWKGDAKYQRSDRFSDRISAEVIDVKPNGTLVIEARRTVTKDEEIQTVVLSGMCRQEDVTSANTVLSTQLADLTITSLNEGELRETNRPGWITRIFRAVFDF